MANAFDIGQQFGKAPICVELRCYGAHDGIAFYDGVDSV
jgi:hypothetical protein